MQRKSNIIHIGHCHILAWLYSYLAYQAPLAAHYTLSKAKARTQITKFNNIINTCSYRIHFYALHKASFFLSLYIYIPLSLSLSLQSPNPFISCSNVTQPKPKPKKTLVLADPVLPNMALSRSESFGSGHFYNYNNNSTSSNSLGYLYNMNIEKRQLFLRSYQFSRKKSLSERIKRSLVRVKRVIWVRLKSARRFRYKLSCFRLAFSYRRRRFVRLINNNNNHASNNYCFW